MTNVLVCRSCGAAKFVPAPHANPVCPWCDRAKRRRCRYCEIAAKRLAQGVLDFGNAS